MSKSGALVTTLQGIPTPDTYNMNKFFENVFDAYKTAGEKARRQLHKNAASNIEQVPEATPNKAPTIRPPASHHKNYTS